MMLLVMASVGIRGGKEPKRNVVAQVCCRFGCKL